jgi:hypothetical protein
MDSLQKARETQLRNIEAKTGRSLEQLRALISQSGLSKHGELRTMLMKELGLGFGDASQLVHYALNTDGQGAAEAQGLSAEDVLAGIYAGAKAHLRPLHEQIVAEIDKFGAYEAVPKKGYVALRRKRQFAMVGPATKQAIEIGINAKELPADARLKAMPAGSMCQYTVRVSQASEIDATLVGWLRQAYEASA